MVSRETSGDAESTPPPAPPLAREVFGDRFEQAQTYASLLADAGVVRGLIGPREVPRLWDRHLLNGVALGELIPDGSTVADLGSGAGLPGIPLALSRPDLRIALVEPLLRRTTFLSEAVTALELDDQVEAVRARAEELHGTRSFDCVTARALAPLERLAGWALPFLEVGGELLALKGSSAQAEVDAARVTLNKLGVEHVEVLSVGSDELAISVVRVVAGRDGTASPRTNKSVGRSSSNRRGKSPR